MKQFYITILLLLNINIICSQSSEVGITSGELSVSLAGSANYSIPISVPPGINGIVPQISLTYNSQSGNGNAGYGWNTAGISTITRIASTKFHDGIIDPVDFDNLDRFSFNGQRLMLKSGSLPYGTNGAVYETENYSNVKITSYGIHPEGINFGPAYFIVEYPDGSKAQYGNSSDSRSITEWSITYWENPQGVRISYNYSFSNNVLDITSVKYGGLLEGAPINEIRFNYEARSRSEQAYIGGRSLSRTKRIKSINVFGNGNGFRNYILDYKSGPSSLNYERLDRITEKNGDNSKSYNPTVFEYGVTTETLSVNASSSLLPLGNINANNSASISGDFDGDGKMDFALYPIIGGVNAYKDFHVFNNISNGSPGSVKVNCGYFSSIFPSNNLTFDGKMYPYQGITIAQLDPYDLNAVSFKTYSNLSQGISLDFEKRALFPQRWIMNCNDSFNAGQGKFFFSGDFNGDGITDVMALDMDIQELVCEPDPYGGPDLFNYSVNSTSQFYFVDLDRRKTNNFINYAGTLQNYFLSTDSKIETFDVNGDGKTDILHFKNGRVYVYTLNNNNQLEFLWETADTDIKITQSILPGDYNGDGKMDFIIPLSTGLYAENYAKYLSTGVGFVKTVDTYPFRNLGNSIEGQDIYTCNLIPLDINADGKTDIVQCRSVYGQAFNGARVMMNVFKNMTTNFQASSTYDTGAQQAIRSYPVPVYLSPKTNNQYLSLGIISNNAIYTFDSKNDFVKEGLLLKITDGNGVKESITYSPLQQDRYEPFYTPERFTETYPNIDIVSNPNVRIVTMLERQSADSYKKQLLHYSGGVLNAEGLGFLGFRSSLRTNWYNDNNQQISTISKNNISLRGANVENFSILGYQLSSTATASSFISRTVKEYNSGLLLNKVFKLKNTKETQFNGLEGTSAETSTEFDFYNNPLSVITIFKEGQNTIQTNTTVFTYKTENISPYYIGVPASKITNFAVSGSTISAEELYEYTNTNYGLLKQIKKKGDSSTNYIIEDNLFDAFGNITKKTITASGLAPRITSFEYDPSGRFLIKSTDIEGLFKTFSYNSSTGVLNSETNQNGLTTTYLYDSWYKKTHTIDYLGKSNTYVYKRSNEKSVIENIGDDGSSTEETFDDQGRKIKTKIKDISGNFSSVDYIYDIYDRNYKISEPYFGNSATRFNETRYDNYGRVFQKIQHTGKLTEISYSGLTTTVSDISKTSIAVKNVMGNIVSMTDNPGGTITYTYFANGGLKEANYAGSKTLINQDGWGRKTMLNDPSAGIYTYEYNDLGEMTKETTPNGSISYILTDSGKIKEKTIAGNGASSKTTYFYNSTFKLLEKTKFEDFINGGSITNDYIYDNQKRVSRVVETTPYAVFSKELTYDAFGRVETTKLESQVPGKSNLVKTRNTYKNGSNWQILDDATSAVLWQTNTLNPKGELLTGLNGPLSITNAYDNYGYIFDSKYDNAANPAINILTLNTVFDALKGNLSSRTNSQFNRTDTFKYDALDRLTEFTNLTGAQEMQSYDDRGRIIQNAVGTYQYDNTKTYQNNAITLTPEALAYYQNRSLTIPNSAAAKTNNLNGGPGAPGGPGDDGPGAPPASTIGLEVTYNTFKSPVSIRERGGDEYYIDFIDFTYNDGNVRSSMFYGGLNEDKLQRRYRKHYSADGSIEIKQDMSTGDVEFITYIGGDGYSAPLVLKSNGVLQNYLYLLRDYQGTINGVCDQNGVLLEKRIFDAWGSIVKVEDGAGNVLAGLTILDRGYTGHEHLQRMALINMNGRLYDPKLHRFLQPDNFVQDSYNTQNYNRYGYCWNNPLRYTDPSGEWVHIVAGAVVGGLVNWGVHGFRMDMQGLKAFGIGAGAGALGAATGGAAFGLAGGAVGGGGGFAAGAVSGGVGTLFSSAFLSVGNNAALGDPMMSGKDMIIGVGLGVLTGGLFNGMLASASGKSFWSGTAKPAVQPVSLPQTAGLANVENASEIKTGDYTITSSTKATTSPTSANNLSTNIDIEKGYVDLSNRPEFNKMIIDGDDLVQVRHHTSTAGLNGIKRSGFIFASRGQVLGVDVEVSPFLKPSEVNLGQVGGGAKGGGGYIEFSIQRSQLLHRDISIGTGNAGKIITNGAPLDLKGKNPIFVKNWWPF